jgi:hypothetical protein
MAHFGGRGAQVGGCAPGCDGVADVWIQAAQVHDRGGSLALIGKNGQQGSVDACSALSVAKARLRRPWAGTPCQA